MNISTLFGFIASLGVFGFALFHSSNNFSLFLDKTAILIVLGGTLAASCVCFSLPRILGLVGVFIQRMLGTSKKNYTRIIEEVVALSDAHRKDRNTFENAIPRVKNPFLKDAAEVLFWLDAEVSIEELRSLLETRAETHYERYLNEAEIFRVMSRFPPAFGLLGTTLGMIGLLQSLGRADSSGLIGPSMSIALVATLYGIVLSNFLFVPIAENLVQQSREDLVARRIVVEGIMLIAADKPSQFVEAKVNSFLLPSERRKSAGRRANPGARKAA